MIAAVIVAVVAAVVIVALAVAMVRARQDAAMAQHQTDALRVELADARQETVSAVAPLAEPVVPLSPIAESPTPAPRPGTPGPVSAGAAARGAALPDEPASDTGAATSSPPEGEPSLNALWALARIRQEWTSRQTAALHLDAEPVDGGWAGATLADVLDAEVARIREDTGTPGTIRTALPNEPAPAQSVLMMTGLQALLEALSRHCQGYDLYVHEWEGRLTAMVVCDGFDGPDRVADDASAVLAAIAPAGGDLALDRDGRGRLRARLSLAALA